MWAGCLVDITLVRHFARSGMTAADLLVAAARTARRSHGSNAGRRRGRTGGSIGALAGSVGRAGGRLACGLAAGLCTTTSTLALGQRRSVVWLACGRVVGQRHAAAKRLAAFIVAALSRPFAAAAGRFTQRVFRRGWMLRSLRRAAFGVRRVRASGRPGLCRKLSCAATRTGRVVSVGAGLFFDQLRRRTASPSGFMVTHTVFPAPSGAGPRMGRLMFRVGAECINRPRKHKDRTCRHAGP